jgi:hypothetical protein
MKIIGGRVFRCAACAGSGRCGECGGKTGRVPAVRCVEPRVSTERRRLARGSEPLPERPLPEWEVRFASWVVFQLAYNHSIANGLLGFRVPFAARVGQAIRVQLRLPDGRLVPIETEVERVSHEQVSVRVADDVARSLFEEMLRGLRSDER